MDTADFVTGMERAEPSLKPEWLLRPASVAVTALRPATSPRAGELVARYLSVCAIIVSRVMDRTVMQFMSDTMRSRNG